MRSVISDLDTKWMMHVYFIFSDFYASPSLPPPHTHTHTHTSTYTVEHGQYQQAGELGERYGDFQVLVQLSERMGSRRQLQEYMKRFSTKVSSRSQTSQTFNDYCGNRLYPP